MSRAMTGRRATEPEPTWDIATLFPLQGEWEENDYLEATESTNRLVELVDGFLEVLPMPKTSHQRIVRFLEQLLTVYLAARPIGEYLPAPLRVRLRPKTFREPDIVFMLSEHADRISEDFVEGADWVLEVVSPDRGSRKRDWKVKLADYARAGVSEYWIVDPQLKKIVVLKLDGDRYVTHSEAGETGVVHSALLPGFMADAAKVWAAAKL